MSDGDRRERGGYARALTHIREGEGRTRRKAKRRFLRYVWALTSPGLRALKQKEQGLPFGVKAERSAVLQRQIDASEGKRPLSRNERRMIRKAMEAQARE